MWNQADLGAYTIRPAVAADESAIRDLVWAAHLNPLGIHWPRFLVAVEASRIVGIGQVKVHGDGSRELASIAVRPERQRQGIARSIIDRLLENEPGELYLICRRSMAPFYERFGFGIVTATGGLPPYFRRVFGPLYLLARMARIPSPSIVMRRAGVRY